MTCRHFKPTLPPRQKFPEDSGYHSARLGQLEIEHTPKITEELLKLGYSDEDVCGVVGENWMRVLERVWR
jgi:microsomal dipeptidase-like Zn-dependent dipeptidase